MAKITIGEGLWSTIYGYLNSMFTELYAAVALNTAKVTNAAHTGDATGSTGLTLATVNSNVGSFTNSSITVNGKGLVTAASSGSAVMGLNPTYITLASTNIRLGERGGNFVVDKVIGGTGFAGTEDVDWANIFTAQ